MWPMVPGGSATAESHPFPWIFAQAVGIESLSRIIVISNRHWQSACSDPTQVQGSFYTLFCAIVLSRNV